MTADRPFTDVEQANHDQVRKALGALGLHDQRRMVAADDLGQFEITISAAELLKLTGAVIEIEQLLYGWFNGGSDYGTPAHRALYLLYLWCEAHDFSHLHTVPEFDNR